jgi:hypothetical protein
VSVVVSSRFAPVKPGAMTAISSGVASTPRSTTTDVIDAISAPTAPATLSASARWPRETSAA